MSETTKVAHPRRKRRLIIWGSIVGAFILIVALLPTIASYIIVPGIIRSSIADKVNGTVAVEGLHLSWFGGQGIERIAIKSTDGSTKLDLNAELHRSLLGLLFGWPNIGNVDLILSGQGILHEDGSTSFATLLRTPPDESTDSKPSTKKPEESGVVPAGFGLNASLKVPSLSLQRKKGDSFVVKNLQANANVKAGGPFTLSLKSSLDVDGKSGAISCDVDLEKGLKADGQLDLAEASLTATITGSELRVPVSSEWADITSLDISMKSSALGKGLSLKGKSNGTLGEKEQIELDADLTVGALVSQAGEFVLGPDTIAGSIHAKSIPTSLLEPLVEGLDVDLTTDIGPSLNADLTAAGGESRTVHVEVDASHFKLVGDASISKTALTNGRFTVDTTMPAELLQKAGLKAGEPVSLAISGSAISLDLDSQGRPDPATFAATITVKSQGTLQLDAGEPITITGLDATISTTSLQKGLDISTTSTVEDAPLTSHVAISDLLGKDGFEFEHAKVKAVVDLQGLQLAKLEPFTKESLPPGVLDAAIGGPISVEADLDLESLSNPNSSEKVYVKLRSADLNASTAVNLDFSAISLEDLSVQSEITPELVRALGVDPKTVGSLDQATTLKIESKKISVKVSDNLSPLINGTLMATVGQAEMTLVDPAETFVLEQSQMKISGLGEKGMSFDSSTKITSKSSPLATVSLTAENSAQDPAIIENIELKAVVSDVASAVKIAGMESGPVQALIGNTATITVTSPGLKNEYDPIDLHATLQSPEAKGDFTGSIHESVLTKAEGAFDGKIEPADFKAAMGEDSEITLKNTVPVKAKFEGTSIPFNMEELNKAKASVSLQVDSAEFVGADGTSVLARSLDGSATLQDGRAQLTVNADILDTPPAGGGKAEQGSIEINSHATLASANKAMTIGETIVELKKVPTLLFDLAGEDGHLAKAALGNTVNSKTTITPDANDSSVIVSKLNSPYAELSMPQGILKEKIFSISGSEPVTGTLVVSKSLSDEILSVLHPIFSDISNTKNPISLSVAPLMYPLDGEMSKLNGEVDLEVGEVTLQSTDAGSQILSLLEKNTTSSLQANIKPLKVKATNGLIEYSNFVIQIGKLSDGSYKQKLIFNGKVNLAANPPTVIGISATYPVKNLVGVFSELQKIPPAVLDTLRPTVTYYGPLYDAKGNRIPLKVKINPIDLNQGVNPDQVDGLIKGIGDLIRDRK